MRILVSVLCGYERHGWLSPELVQVLLGFQRERQEVAISLNADTTPVERARNFSAQQALEFRADWLLMLDNDVQPPANVLRVLDGAGPAHDVICLPYWGVIDGLPAVHIVGENGRFEPRSGFQEIKRGGTGAIFIRRRVLEKMPKPHFSMRLSKDGLQLLKGEDFDFCDRARELGFRIWTHGAFPVEHSHQFQLGYLAEHLRLKEPYDPS